MAYLFTSDAPVTNGLHLRAHRPRPAAGGATVIVQMGSARRALTLDTQQWSHVRGGWTLAVDVPGRGAAASCARWTFAGGQILLLEADGARGFIGPLHRARVIEHGGASD